MKRALAVLMLSCLPRYLAAAFSTDTVKAGLTAGEDVQCSIAFDARNNVHAAFYDSTAGKIRYARLANGSTSWAVEDIDPGVVVHSSQTAIALHQFTPHVVYYDITNGALKHARRSSAGVWVRDTVEAFTASTTAYCSIAMDSAGNPRVAYYNSPSSTTKYGSFSGAAWSTFTVVNATSPAGSVDIALDGQDRPGIAFVFADVFRSSAGFIFAMSPSGGSYFNYGVSILNTSTSPLGNVSLAFDADGDAHISNYQAESSSAIYHQISNIALSTFSSNFFEDFDQFYSHPDPAAGTGFYSSIGVNAQGNPRIVYSSTSGLRYVEGTVTDASANWSAPERVSLSTASGVEASMVLNARGKAMACYFDGSSFSFATNAARDLSISGTARDGAGAPLAGVDFRLAGVDEAFSSTTTGASGTYGYGHLFEAPYTVTPSKSGFSFLPPSSSFLLASDVANLDFTGGRLEFRLADNLIDPTLGESVTLNFSVFDGDVLIAVYDLRGRLIKTLVDEYKPIGSYSVSWDGKNEEGHVVASGIYPVQIKANGVKSVEKIAVVK